MIPAGDITDLQAAFVANPRDLGVGLYNPSTGEIRIRSFDQMTGGQGHQGLANILGIQDHHQWRGFIITANGDLFPISHFNLVDGALTLKPADEALVRVKLLQAGLIF